MCLNDRTAAGKLIKTGFEKAVAARRVEMWRLRKCGVGVAVGGAVALLILQVMQFIAGPAAGWNSCLYPLGWEPGFSDARGRFLQDFS